MKNEQKYISFRNKRRVFKVEGNERHRIEAFRLVFIGGILRTGLIFRE